MPVSSAPESSRENTDRPSNAVQQGADLLLELFNKEKSQLILVYRENFEKRFNQFKAEADSQLAKKTALLGDLSAQYDKSVRDLEVTRNELQHVRAEHAKLIASIEDVGLVYMNGTLQFNDGTANIISDFLQKLHKIISHINPLSPDHNIEAFPKAFKPSDFFVFLSGVKDRCYARYFKTNRQHQATLSEGNILQDSECEEELSLVWPGAYRFSSVPSPC